MTYLPVVEYAGGEIVKSPMTASITLVLTNIDVVR